MRATPEAAGTTRTPAPVSRITSSSARSPRQHVLERVARRQSEQHIDVGEPEIAVQQHGRARPACANAVARFTATEVLPVPPLPPVTAMTCTGAGASCRMRVQAAA